MIDVGKQLQVGREIWQLLKRDGGFAYDHGDGRVTVHFNKGRSASPELRERLLAKGHVGEYYRDALKMAVIDQHRRDDWYEKHGPFVPYQGTVEVKNNEGSH